MTEVIRRFRPVRRTRSTASPMGSIGMVWRQGMDFWNVCNLDHNHIHGESVKSASTAGEMIASRNNVTCVLGVSPSLSELLAEGMLSSRSGMLSNVARSSLCTTIFSLPFDLSISFLASISDKFSVTVPLICQGEREASAPERDRPGNCLISA